MKLVVLLLGSLSALAFAMPALATVHSGHIQFLEPKGAPTIGTPKPPLDQQSEYAREVLIRYDASLGVVTFEVEVWAPIFWGETLLYRGFKTRPISFQLAPNCEGSALEGSLWATPKVAAVPPKPEEGEPWRETEGTPAYGGVEGEAKLSGYGGSIRSVGNFNGERFSAVLTDPAFRNRNWRCVSLENGFSFPLGEWPHPHKKKWR